MFLKFMNNCQLLTSSVSKTYRRKNAIPFHLYNDIEQTGDSDFKKILYYTDLLCMMVYNTINYR